jgi:2,4-dienoyl-CoA reductase-like NADH-dependent reductase (Old Yellow Enzyme family)
LSILFDAMRIGNLQLRNRFVRSATGDGFADHEGHVSAEELQMLSALSRGGVGLIVTGIAHVHPLGRISDHQLSIASDDCIPGLQKLVDVAHEGGAAIAAQLFHAGREGAAYLRAKGLEAMGPSLVAGDAFFTESHRVMDEADFREAVHAFGDAAERAQKAGFDAVQLHAAHGYLFSQLLSSYTNLRSDAWGGSLAHRLRFHLEVCDEIRARLGQDFPILIKLGVQDGFNGGLALEEGVSAARKLSSVGVDCIEVSQGLRGVKYQETEYRTKINKVADEGYFRVWTRAVMRSIDVPVMIVGGLRTFRLMEDIVQQGDADFISLSRPLICEPDLIKRWQEGDRRKSACVSCNKCYESLIADTGTRCLASSA